MDTSPSRRTLLAGIGAVAVAGCVGDLPGDGRNGDDNSSDGNESLPEECPTTQGIDVEWPDELDIAAVESFVEAYEHVYFRDFVVEYEPESRVDEYRLTVSVHEGPTEAGDGYTLLVRGGGGVYTPLLHLTAQTVPVPEGREPVLLEEIEDALLRDLLEEAVETPDEKPDRYIDSPGEEVERYLERFATLDEGFGPMESPGDSGRLYVNVDGETVELEVRADQFHGDYGWTAKYYVDEHVVRRTVDRGPDEDRDPQEGELLECRESA